MNNLVFVKTIVHVRKYRDIKGVTTEVRRNYLLSEPNYHKYFFSENLLAIVMGKILVVLNKPVYLGLSISELSKIVMHKIWYDYVKPKYGDKAKLCYMDRNSFMMCIKKKTFI